VAEVTIRYEPTGEERQIDETAVPFFIRPESPGWVQLKSNGAVNPKPATPVNNADKKD
jgi:hypothetical protein